MGKKHVKGTFFGDYAWYFHLLKMGGLDDLIKIFQQYDRALKSYGAQRILDIGCGTGVFTPFFIDEGYSYIGLDLSESMLAIAREHEQRGQYVLGDMRRLDLQALPSKTPFDAVTCMGRTLCHLIPDADIEACLAGVFHVLKPGGLFLCDVPNANATTPRLRAKEHSSETKLVEGGKVFLHITSTELPSQGAGFSRNVHIIADIDVKTRKKESVEYEFNIRAFTAEEMSSFLANGGFNHFSAMPYSSTQQSLFVTAEKSDSFQ